MKQIFTLTTPNALSHGTRATIDRELHTLASVSARIGAARSSVWRWISSGDLPSKQAAGGRYMFETAHLNEFELRLRLARQRKAEENKKAEAVAAVLADPGKATNAELLTAYNSSRGFAQEKIWKEYTTRLTRQIRR